MKSMAWTIKINLLPITQIIVQAFMIKFSLMLKSRLIQPKLMLPVLLLLLSGCVQKQTGSASSQSSIPDLNPLAYQPERSYLCLPTCSMKAMSIISEQQKKLTGITTLE